MAQPRMVRFAKPGHLIRMIFLARRGHPMRAGTDLSAVAPGGPARAASGGWPRVAPDREESRMGL